MLDYTLVSTKATYRLLTPRDVPAYVHMVQAFHREVMPGEAIAVERIAATVRELEHNRDRGTVFVFDSEGSLIGYCILVNRWSNARGGVILCVDELYVVPGQRGQGIASDFLSLLEKVAPPDCRAIQMEVKDGNRRAQKLCRKLGFEDARQTVLSRRIEREP